MINAGSKKQNEAMDYCKNINAKLPLPKSKAEQDEFMKVTKTSWVWIGIKDETKFGVKANWKDVEGNPIGNAYVNLRVINFKILESFFCIISEPTNSGEPVNQTKME